jgi:hypothetical protein
MYQEDAGMTGWIVGSRHRYQAEKGRVQMDGNGRRAQWIDSSMCRGNSVISESLHAA